MCSLSPNGELAGGLPPDLRSNTLDVTLLELTQRRFKRECPKNIYVETNKRQRNLLSVGLFLGWRSGVGGGGGAKWGGGDRGSL